MTRCWKPDCSGEVIGSLAHTYMPGGWVWYCVDHSPSSDYWQNRTQSRIADALERIAATLEAPPSGKCDVAAKVDVATFRRLCVEYGEARAKYEHVPPYQRTEWGSVCDGLWAKVQTAEAELMRGRQ